MKQCPTCNEEFADKFGFCPVDGTPLGVASPAPVAQAQAAEESVVTAAASASESSEGFPQGNNEEAFSSQPTVERGEYHLTFIQDVGLTRRLARELKEVAHDAELTWPEFRRDPLGFTKRSASAYGRAAWKFFSQRNVAVAVMTAFVVVFGLIGLVAGIERFRNGHSAS